MKSNILVIIGVIALSSLQTGCDWFKKSATPIKSETDGIKVRSGSLRDSDKATSSQTKPASADASESSANGKTDNSDKKMETTVAPTTMGVVDSKTAATSDLKTTDATVNISKHETAKGVPKADSVVTRNLRDSSQSDNAKVESGATINSVADP